ncbi:hypothetical protein CBR_g38878 [Chara braunii]|uniref:Aquaporin n=1 Tax=Chara braunii TaxID=69332 RepID=A0A388LQR6_CHABU|nr:hypothetical protein CBR_g38878 [Chara braunii]|eukprot:GBG84595.1 hypothetical protein CBR_g38878 [Chara braunii]
MDIVGTVKLCLADLFVSVLWVYVGSGIAVAASALSPYLGASEFTVVLLLIFVISIGFELLCGALGGASFNMAVDLAVFTAGVGSERTHSVPVLACRFPAQMAGSVLGAMALDRTAPTAFRHMIVGAKLQADVHLYLGMSVEMGLAFLLNIAILWSVLACPEGRTYLKSGIPLFTTLVLICFGSPYTGASMNPGTAFAWAYFEERHVTAEHFLVYWVGTMMGAVLAAFFAAAIWRETKDDTRDVKVDIKPTKGKGKQGEEKGKQETEKQEVEKANNLKEEVKDETKDKDA